MEKEEDQALISLLVLSFIFWGIYIEEVFAGFFPSGFSEDKSLCSLLYGCACLYFSDPVYMLLL